MIVRASLFAAPVFAILATAGPARATAIASASPKLNAVIASARSDHRYAMNSDAIAMLAR
jgi:hypothetical protein